MALELKYKDEWLELASQGKFSLAEELYYEKLFPEILKNFEFKYGSASREKETLISILGFSPEPIILTARALKPVKHFILTNEIREDIIKRIEGYLENDFKIVSLTDLSFSAIYKSLKEIVYDLQDINLTLDITGGKKSMVSSASIFGKDYRSRIVYVDFDDYIKELRKPVPGSEYLSIVYDPEIDQPELYLK
jgi:hypothetical protein